MDNATVVANILMFIAVVLFMAAQGGAIFATAFLTLLPLKTPGPLSKIAAMLVSWVAWVAFTIVGYAMLGGEGGLMDGFGMLLSLLALSPISSAIYTAIWLLAPYLRRAASAPAA